jgi:hypothetical protein
MNSLFKSLSSERINKNSLNNTILSSSPEDEFKIDVDFDPEDEINEDRIAITVLTKSDDIEGYLDKYFLVYKQLDEARKLLASECKHVGFFVQYAE